jgi:hypothetical protein
MVRLEVVKTIDASESRYVQVSTNLHIYSVDVTTV